MDPLCTAAYAADEQSIDMHSEEVQLASASHIVVDALPTTISADQPRYSFFKYRHDFEGRTEAPILFFYTCPSESKIKERMLYATAKGVLVHTAGTGAGLTVVKKVKKASSGMSVLIQLVSSKPPARANSRRRPSTKSCTRGGRRRRRSHVLSGLGRSDGDPSRHGYPHMM